MERLPFGGQSLHVKAWRDPLITTMTFYDCTERFAPSPPPPVVPMLMQFVNTHNAEEIAGASVPNWHTRIDRLDADDGARRRRIVVRDAVLLTSPEFIACLPTITELHVTTPVNADWSFLSSMPKLRAFSLSRSCGSRQLKLPSTLRRLELVGDAASRTVESLVDLSCLPFLGDLRLQGPFVNDLDYLSVLPRLTRVNVASATLSTAGIRGLGRCPSLTALDVAWCSEVTDVSGLALSTSLRTLVVHPRVAGHPSLLEVCESVVTLRSLIGIPLACATHIHAIRTNITLPLTLKDASDIDHLYRAANFVERLEIENMSLSQWAPFRHLAALSIEDSASEVDLSELAMLPALTFVSLGTLSRACPTRGSWKGSLSLKVLMLGGDGFAGIASVATLRELYCTPQTREDMECVAGCRGLVKLVFWGFPVKEEWFLPMLNGMMLLEKLEFLQSLSMPSVAEILSLNLPRLLSVRFGDGTDGSLKAAIRQRYLHTSWYLGARCDQRQALSFQW